MKRNKLLLLIYLLLLISCKKSVDSSPVRNPSDLKYINVTDTREGRAVTTLAPTVETGGLVPAFELISITDANGNILDASYSEYVSIGESFYSSVRVNEGISDENGNPVTAVPVVNSAANGVITIRTGHKFTAGDYYFTIKVSTQYNGIEYSTVFDKGFHLHVAPLLPATLVYSPKNQNLVYGSTESKTTTPIMPNANPEVSFELATGSDKLSINKATGSVSLAPGYVYTKYDTLTPVIRVVSNISGETVLFENKLRVIITDKPEVMPIETIYFFYPALYTTGSYPSGGEGFSVQVIQAGNGEDIWGEIDNSNGKALVAPVERPKENTRQTILETQTYNSANVTKPTTSWMVTTTQDLTPFQYGYELSFNYYYMPAFQTYMADGRTPTDMEVYISTDYTGGTIQDAEGNWLNGTWTKVNETIRCRRSEGTGSTGVSSGAPWGPEFTGTPYPGDQKGADPDNRKRPALGTFYGKWVQCSYNIPQEEISPTFTVAFKIASYFDGEIRNNTSAPGRGGIYFLSDFNYKAIEPAN